ncbi:MAG: hypothetical protein DMD79_26880, partial [Candidatus Rokuibacteriota bacterium]
MVVRRDTYPQVDPRAAGLMTAAVTVVPGRLTVGEAARLAHRRRARLLVARPRAGRDVGWAGVTPDTLEQALALGLAGAPMTLLLWTMTVVGPETPEVAVRRRLRPGVPGLVVVAGGCPVG